MIKRIASYFVGEKTTGYNSGLSNFMRNADAKERKKVFLKVARQATEDQRRIIEQAAVK